MIKFASPLVFSAVVLLTGCATQAPSPEVSHHVIQSLMPESNKSEKPWRLRVTLLPGQLSGAAIRPTAYEHVVTRKAQLTTLYKDSESTATPLVQSVSNAMPVGHNWSSDEVDRAWRKYCHNRQQMSAREEQIIQETPAPFWTHKNCYTKNLLK
jgi:hypothetical protein